MNWLTTLWTVAKGIAPSVTSILPVAALAFALGSALGGWAGHKICKSEATQCLLDCTSEKLKAAQAMLAYNQMIAAQDAEIWSTAQERTVTRWRTRDGAIKDFSASGVPDSTLSPAGLRAIQTMYQPSPSRAAATVDLMRAANQTGGRAVPDGGHGGD